MGPNERVKERRSPIGLLILSRFLQCSRGKRPGVGPQKIPVLVISKERPLRGYSWVRRRQNKNLLTGL